MERKIVKQGRNAGTVTLPSSWIKERALDFGDYVHIKESEKDLIISASKVKHKIQRVEINVENFEESIAYHVLFAKYVEGYDEIIIRHSNSQLIQQIASSLFGMVIEENTPTTIILKNLVAEPTENINALITRIARLFAEHVRLLNRVIKKEVSNKEVKAHEKIVDELVLYCMRFINKYETNSESYRLFLLCSTLEYAIDQTSKIATVIGDNQELADKIILGVENYVKNLLISDMKKMYKELRAFRNSLQTETFVDGLAYSLAETLYNNMAYLLKEN